MLIIVEGIDRVGKTTLCNRISEKFNIPIWKEKLFTADSYEPKAVAEQMMTVIKLSRLLKKDLILDRFHLSEIVYGIVERRYDSPYMWIIDNAIRDEACMILVDPVDLSKSSEEHGKDLTSHDDWFKKIFNDSRIHAKIQTNWNHMDFAEHFVEVSKTLIGGG